MSVSVNCLISCAYLLPVGLYLVFRKTILKISLGKSSKMIFNITSILTFQ